MNTPGPWWQAQLTIIAAMILVFPVGLYLMWRYAPWRLRSKWIWSSVFALLVTLIIVGSLFGDDNKRTEATTQATPTELDTDTPTSGETETAAVGTHCGTERWPVKTLSDREASSVNSSPVPATVAELDALTAPASLPQASRVAPVELTTYWVVASVVEYKMEDDRDIHVVIADAGDPSLTMIVEFPNADACDGAIGSIDAGEMKSARAALIAAYGEPPTSHFEQLSGSASFVGVGFFDFKHGQTGVAPNAIELHPVLAFSTGASAVEPTGPASIEPTSTRPVSPPPTPTPAPIVGGCGPTAPSNPFGYDFCAAGGSLIVAPAAAICSYFACIASFWDGVGYVIECGDGTYSRSGGRRGSCSGHDGSLRPLYAH